MLRAINLALNAAISVWKIRVDFVKALDPFDRVWVLDQRVVQCGKGHPLTLRKANELLVVVISALLGRKIMLRDVRDQFGQSFLHALAVEMRLEEPLPAEILILGIGRNLGR